MSEPKTKLSNQLNHLFEKIRWQDILLGFIILLYFFLQTNLLSSFKQLPSPIYGGDYYYSMGTVQHVLNGGNPFASSNVLNSEPGYLPLYPICVSILGWIFHLTAFVAMKYFAILQMIAALIVFYYFSNYLFKNRSIALICTLLYLPLMAFPVFKYSQFTLTLLFPAFFFSMFWFFNKRNVLSAAVAGLIFGLTGISHTIFFVGEIFFLIVFSLYFLFFEHFEKHDKKRKFDKEAFKKSFLKKLSLLIILGVIGLAIAMLYWYRPIFVYHGVLPASGVVNRSYDSFNLGMQFIGEFLQYDLFNFSTPVSIIYTLLFLAGLASLLVIKKYDSPKRFLVLMLVASIIGGFHLFITQPLIGTHFAANQLRGFMFSITGALFAGLSLGVLSSLFKKFKHYALMALLALIIILCVVQFNSFVRDDRWIGAGRTELSPNLKAMQEWVLKGTNVNDVFLSTNELSFSLNALTGRKEVNGRRAHNSMFLDNDQRHLAAAIMLYGNDTSARKALLKEYQVKYLYWDYYWIQSDFVFDQSGKMTSWFDPLMFIATPEHLDAARRYNLSAIRQVTAMDPTTKEESVKKYDVAIVIPNQFNMTHPWHPDLDNYLQEIWNFSQNGVTYSRIYRIVNLG